MQFQRYALFTLTDHPWSHRVQVPLYSMGLSMNAWSQVFGTPKPFVFVMEVFPYYISPWFINLVKVSLLQSQRINSTQLPL